MPLVKGRVRIRTVFVSGRRQKPKELSSAPFPDELPRLLRDRNETLRSLARAIEGLDHAYLSRMINRKAPVNSEHAQKIALYFDLPPDYFPEVREAAAIAAIKAQSGLRDKVYREIKGRQH